MKTIDYKELPRDQELLFYPVSYGRFDADDGLIVNTIRLQVELPVKRLFRVTKMTRFEVVDTYGTYNKPITFADIEQAKTWVANLKKFWAEYNSNR